MKEVTPSNDKSSSQPLQDTALADILLSLKTSSSCQSTSSTSNTTTKIESPVATRVLTKQEKRCPSCQYDSYGCYRCCPDRWASCNEVLRQKYQHFNPAFSPNDPFEKHAREFIHHHRIKSFNLSRVPFQHIYVIPLVFRHAYLTSVERMLLFPIDRSTKGSAYSPAKASKPANVPPAVAVNTKLKRKYSDTDYPTPPGESELTSPTQDEMDPTPRRQETKSKNDQYTPKWVRYSGAKKEGLCDLCVPEKWLQLKDSAFWYHKQFFHGISSACGTPFLPPIEHRAVWDGLDHGGGFNVYLMAEGLCGHCKQWIPMFKNKKRFSHYFCTLDYATKELCGGSNPENSAEILSKEPLKIKVARDNEGRILVPNTVSVSPTLLTEIDEYAAGKMGGVWWRHAHKCHVYETMN